MIRVTSFCKKVSINNYLMELQYNGRMDVRFYGEQQCE